MFEGHFAATKFGNPIDRNALKQAIYAMMLQDDNRPLDYPKRQFIWGRFGDEIVIRTAETIPEFTAMAVPKGGDIVAFNFHAAPKVGRNASTVRRSWENGRHSRVTQRSAFDTISVSDWAAKKLLEAGLDVLAMEAVGFDTVINHVTATMNDRFNFRCAAITGEAKVVDAYWFGKALLNGIAASGPRCWGFGTIII